MDFKIELEEEEAKAFVRVWIRGGKYHSIVVSIADQIQSQLSSQKEDEVEELARKFYEFGSDKESCSWEELNRFTKELMKNIACFVFKNFERKEGK